MWVLKNKANKHHLYSRQQVLGVRQADYDRELALVNEFQAKSISSYGDYYD